MKTLKRLAAALIVALSTPAFAEQETVDVGLGGYNTFTFNVPFDRVLFPPKSAIRGKPIPINGNTTILVELEANATAPVQMVASLSNGTVETLILRPVPGTMPITWKQNSFGDTDNFRTPIQRPEDEWLQQAFYAAVQGKIPEGFSAVPPPSAGMMGELTANYIAAFRNEAFVMLVARLESQELRWITPQDLYVPGVKAVLVDGDRVGVKDAPIAYILIAGEK